MGYLSETAFKVEFGKIEDRDRVIGMLPTELQALVREVVNIPEERPVLYAHYPMVKWYTMSGYDQVNAVESLLDLCRRATDGLLEGTDEVIPNVGFFARVGEDTDDIEERIWEPPYSYQNGHPDYDLPDPWDLGQVQRTIVLEED